MVFLLIYFCCSLLPVHSTLPHLPVSVFLSQGFMSKTLLIKSYKMMDQRTNSPVYIEVLSEPMNFPLSVSPSKEMGERTRQRKNL